MSPGLAGFLDLPVLLIALAAIAIYRGELTYVLPAFIFGGASLAAAYAGMRIFNVRWLRASPAQRTPQMGRTSPTRCSTCRPW